MAAGDVFLSTDVDRWLFGVLSGDPLMQVYAPGGFWSQDPDQVAGGVWSSVGSYAVGDVAIASDGLPYRAVTASQGQNPVANPDNWAACFPCVRWWALTQGYDVLTQDGQSSRAESLPIYVVTVLDRQRGGVVDKVWGSNGNLEVANLRLTELLHNRLNTIVSTGERSLRFFSVKIAAYEMVSSPTEGGSRDVMVGGRYRLSVQ